MRYGVESFPVECPDGYNRTFYYIWDSKVETIVEFDTVRIPLMKKAGEMNEKEKEQSTRDSPDVA